MDVSKHNYLQTPKRMGILNVFLVVVFLLSFSIAALADQAAWVTKAQARKAVALLKKQKLIRHWCPPCGDEFPSPEDVDRVKIEYVESKFWRVRLNDEEIDLAYIYFKTPNGRWKNLAVELKIKVEQVPTFMPGKFPVKKN
jgi:hypothetical protein